MTLNISPDMQKRGYKGEPLPAIRCERCGIYSTDTEKCGHCGAKRKA